MRFVGNFLYLSFGIGNGINETNSFYPPNSAAEWREHELMENEVACHTVVDHAGDIIKGLDTYFNARPAGMKLTCTFAGHADALEFVRNCGTNYRHMFYTED